MLKSEPVDSLLNVKNLTFFKLHVKTFSENFKNLRQDFLAFFKKKIVHYQ